MSNQATRIEPDFFRLLWSVCDNCATTDEFARLEELVLEDDHLCRVYTQFMALHSDLLWQSETSERLVDDSRRKAGERSPVLMTLATPTSAAQRSRYSTLYSILAVAVAFYGCFALISWNLRSLSTAKFGGVQSKEVAKVFDTADAKWVSQPLANEVHTPSIQANAPLAIESGRVWIELERGVKLSVEGPAQWSIIDGNHAKLDTGKLVAVVPPQAIGFTLDTPCSRIVDLGTEFGVEVARDGTTEVEVLKGSVELLDGPTDAVTTGTKQSLSAGQALRVEKSGSGDVWVTKKIAPQAKRFSQVAATSTIPREIRVKRAFASSTIGSDRLHAENLIRGRGLTKSSHSAADLSGYYWHTDPGHVQGEYVVFEFAEPQTLTSMVVWNYNQPGFCHRGIKEADIYVSDAGTGDPAKTPTEWRKVVAKQTFSMAPGNAEIDFSDVVLLNRTKARFVAIVINEIFDPAASCAGLSEVQFFGLPPTVSAN